VTGCAPEHLRALISKIEESGAEVTEPEAGALRVRVKGKLRSADMTTEEHPGFATDLQAQFMALMTQPRASRSLPRRFSRTASCTRRSWRAWARTSAWTDAARLWPAVASYRARSDRQRPARKCVLGAGGAGRAGRNVD